MTDTMETRVVRALENHGAFEPGGSAAGESGDPPPADRETAGEAAPVYALTTTPFDTAVSITGTADGSVQMVLTARVPMLSAAVIDSVGPAVEDGWFETLEVRLADAPMATRAALELDQFSLRRDGDTAIATFGFEWDDPEEAVAIARTLGEYVEGTYVEGVVPGYEYDDPVAELLARAASGDDDGRRGPTPL